MRLVSELLEGKTVDLRIRERDDIDFLAEWYNDIDFWGECVSLLPLSQISKSEMLKRFDNPSNLDILTEIKVFIVQKKDGTKIGVIFHRLALPNKWMEIAYFLVPSERGKGYGTEATQLIVDYLFLSRELVRIHAYADVRNRASQRVLEKVGFQREGTMRKCSFNRGKWADWHLYSILREELKEPHILTRTT